MKKTVIFLLAAVLLVGGSFMAQAQPGAALSASEANSLLLNMSGNWRVRTLIWQPEENKFFEADGQVRYKPDETQAIHETFSIQQPDGTTRRYSGTLRYIPFLEQFEFLQYDAQGRAEVLMTGKWNPRFNMIALEPVKGQKNLSGKGKLRMQLQYFFFDDGSFKKVTKTPDGKGNYLIASEYHCLRQNTAEL